jgi:hypothetical protein
MTIQSPQRPIPRSAESDRLPERTARHTKLPTSPLHEIRLAKGNDEPSKGVIVANHRYSPGIQGRAVQLIRSAELYELHAAKLQGNPPRCVPPLLMRRIVDKLITRALLYREAAKLLARDGELSSSSLEQYLAPLNS